MTTMQQQYEFYAQAVGTQEVRPVLRVNRVTRPPTIWCPFCDTSAHLGFRPVCLKCNATWIAGAMMQASEHVEGMLGRPLLTSLVPVAPPMPEVPERLPGEGYASWTAEELAAGADKARLENDLDTMLALTDELEGRRYADGAAGGSTDNAAPGAETSRVPYVSDKPPLTAAEEAAKNKRNKARRENRARERARK